MKQVSFTVSAADRKIIKLIVDRAVALAKKNGAIVFDSKSIDMDITATHANGNPLRLQDLLVARDFDFAHDIYGIHRHLNRNTGKLMNHFRPRFSKPE